MTKFSARKFFRVIPSMMSNSLYPFNPSTMLSIPFSNSFQSCLYTCTLDCATLRFS